MWLLLKPRPLFLPVLQAPEINLCRSPKTRFLWALNVTQIIHTHVNEWLPISLANDVCEFQCLTPGTSWVDELSSFWKLLIEPCVFKVSCLKLVLLCSHSRLHFWVCQCPCVFRSGPLPVTGLSS